MILTAEEIRQKQIEKIKHENKDSLLFYKIMEEIQKASSLNRNYAHIDLKELSEEKLNVNNPFYTELIILGYKVNVIRENYYRIHW